MTDELIEARFDMSWLSRKRRARGSSGPAGQARQAVREMLDPYHQRASVSEDDRMLIEPGKVLANIALAMERVDTDISTPVSIEDDVAPAGELMRLTQIGFGALLAVHVANTAMQIMSARYPADLVRRPLPAEFDLRKLTPVTMTDQQHEIAKTIFNRRTARTADLDEDDVPEMESLAAADQVQVFIALFFMFGKKAGALKYTTGID